MSKKTFFILGLWIAILPYLGIPIEWKKILVTISGILVVLSTISFDKKGHKQNNNSNNSNNSVDNVEPTFIKENPDIIN